MRFLGARQPGRLTSMKKTPVYLHSHNPAVDRPLFSAGRAQLEMLLATGAVLMCGKFAQYVRDRKDYVAPPVSRIPLTPEQLTERGYDQAGCPEHFSPAQITCAESRRNALGCADQGKRRLTGAELTAMRKVANYGRASWEDCIVVKSAHQVTDGREWREFAIAKKAMAAHA
jgi:hypothetical protein